MEENKFRKEIEAAINRSSMENGSNTPDFILAEFLDNCLKAFDIAINRREHTYSMGPIVPGKTQCDCCGEEQC